MLNFLSEVLVWLPKIFYPLGFVWAAYVYLRSKERASRLKTLLAFIIGFRVLYAGLETIGQYFVWSATEFGKLFLPPKNSVWYFIKYTGLHFWLSALIAILCGVISYFFLKALRRHQDRFFEDGEVELGMVAVLLSGWPNFVIFLGVLFFSVILVSIARAVVLREAYTTLGAPFLVASGVMLIWGARLVYYFNLGVLKI